MRSGEVIRVQTDGAVEGGVEVAEFVGARRGGHDERGDRAGGGAAGRGAERPGERRPSGAALPHCNKWWAVL